MIAFRVKKWFLPLTALVLANSSVAFAWFEPGISYTTAFSSLKTKDPNGTEINLPTSRYLQVHPELLWHLTPEGHKFRIRGKYQLVSYDTPSSTTLSPNSFSLFGGDVQYQMPFRKFTLGLGLEGSQIALTDVSSGYTFIGKTSYYLGVPIEGTYKLLVLERQVIRLGLSSMLVLPVSSDVSTGFRVVPYLGYELRGMIRTQVQFFYDLGILSTSTGTRAETSIGAQIRIGFPGRKGVGPSPDERG